MAICCQDGSRTVFNCIVPGLGIAGFLCDKAIRHSKRTDQDYIVATFKNERTKLYILSLVQNPAVLFKTSEIAEREGALDSAIRDIELAIGLLELHGADKQVIKRYNARLDMLKVAITKPSK